MSKAPIAQGPVDVNVSPLACPFCGKPVDLEDNDTLYPSGTGWIFDEEIQMRTYHRYTKTPKEQWCYTMHCPVQAGGCGAEMHGDTRGDALSKWNKRPNAKVSGAGTASAGLPGYASGDENE